MKLCSECRHALEGADHRLKCSLVQRLSGVHIDTTDTSFQRNSAWITDCGPEGHKWEARDGL